MFAQLKAKFTKTETQTNEEKEMNMTEQEQLQQLVDAKPENVKGNEKDADARPGMAKRVACGSAAVATAPVVGTLAVTEGALEATGIGLHLASVACINASQACGSARTKTSSFMSRMWSEFKQGAEEGEAQANDKILSK